MAKTLLGLLEQQLDYLAVEAQQAQKLARAGEMTLEEMRQAMDRFSRAVHEVGDNGGRHVRLLQGKPEPIGAARRRALFSVNEKTASVTAPAAFKKAA